MQAGDPVEKGILRQIASLTPFAPRTKPASQAFSGVFSLGQEADGTKAIERERADMPVKILCFADLHIETDSFPSVKRRWLQESIARERPDVLVIAGDLSETPLKYPFATIRDLSLGLPVVYCLGNHEFYYRTPQETLAFHRGLERPENVHCLDVHGSFLFQKGGVKVRFIGNMLGYDGSLKDYEWQVMEEFADGTWPDKYITEWESQWLAHHKACVAQIEDGLKEVEPDEIAFLVTHTVPHGKLNTHIRPGEYNAFSGVRDFLETHSFDYAVCGHTHRLVDTLMIHGCVCRNVGNGYDEPFKSCVFEI